MKVAVVAYPTLNRADHEWIEALRARHDPQAARIKAHVTVVFPVEAAPDDLDREVALVAASTERIGIQIARAAVQRDAFSDTYLVVLDPDEGRRDIATMHGRLYAGVLEPQLRRDIPFVPHVTIAVAPDRQAAEALAAAVDRRGTFRGELTSLALIDADAPVARTISTYRLGIGPACRGCR